MPFMKWCGGLRLCDVLSHWPSIGILNLECHLFTLREAFESGRVNGREVNKDVSSVFLLNEPVTLFIAKPLYRSLCQGANLLSKSLYMVPNLRSPLWQRTVSFGAKPTRESSRPPTLGTIKQSPAKIKQKRVQRTTDNHQRTLSVVTSISQAVF
jgi:hypothetical protein